MLPYYSFDGKFSFAYKDQLFSKIKISRVKLSKSFIFVTSKKISRLWKANIYLDW